jgi:hypothetical protein
MICKRSRQDILIGIVSTLTTVLLCLSAPVSAITAQEVLDKHIKALGGKKALARISSVAAYASVDYMGMQGKEVYLVKYPAKCYTHFNLRVSEQSLGFDGVTGWMTDPNGAVREFSVEEIRPILSDLYFTTFAYLLAGQLTGHTAYQGDTTIQDKHFHKLLLYPDGGDSLCVLINAANGLPEYRLEKNLGSSFVSTYSDFRPVEGVMMPFVMSLTSPDSPFLVNTKIDSTKVNVEIPDSIFTMPGKGGADFKFPEQTDSIVVPCPPDKNRLFINVRINGRGPFRFMLDSGAGSTVLSQRVAAILGINVSGNTPARGIGGFGNLGFGDIDSLDIGELTLRFSKIMVADFDSLSGSIMSDLDGILGYDFFARFPIRIDFPDSILIIYRPGYATKDKFQNDIPLEIYYQMPLVTGELDGQPLRLVLDLGAQAGVVLQRNSPGFQLVMKRAKELSRTTRIAGIGGSQDVYSAVMDSLRIGSHLITSPTVLALNDASGLPLPDYIEGLVGFEILKRFDLYLDYSRGRMWLEMH